jgi:hypothetical protein
MKSLLIVSVVVFSILGFKTFKFFKSNTNKFQKVTFQEQLSVFEKLGYKFNNGVTVKDLLRWEKGESAFEKEPWTLLYITLGQTIEKEPWTPITNKCWNFDLEAIEDHGAYIDIMENISRITNGDLIFKDLKDYVDIEEEKAWVSFSINEDKYKWDLKVDNDWADGDLFDRVQTLTKKYKTQGKFTYFDTGGQDFVLGYHSENELKKIKEATGLKIEWLNAKGQIY